MRSFARILPLIALLASACTVDVPDISAFPDAADVLDAGTDALDAGTDALAAGTDVLDAGTDALDAGTDALAAGTDVLDAGTDALDAGTDALDAGTDALDAADAETTTADAGEDVQADAGPCPGGCDDGNPCTDDACDLAAGCTHTANTASCSDGSLCTLGDVCGGGACLPGATTSCDDGNACTTDSCDPSAGCKHDPNAVSCSDGNACTVNDVCASGACSGGSAPSCDDNQPCTDDGCDASLGCTHAANTASCSDGSLCTLGDVCGGGACLPGAATSCDDGNACTTDSCDPSAGCKHGNLGDGTACGVGGCVDNATCKAGACSGGSPLLWQVSKGGALHDEVSAVVALDDGGVVVVLRTRSQSAGNDDAWIFRLDKYGKEVWNLNVGGSGDDELVAGVQDGGTIAFVGSTTSSSAGGKDLWFLHVTTAGVVGDNVKFGGISDDWGEAIVPTGTGFAIAGANGSKATTKPQAAWLLFIDKSGNFQNEALFSSPTQPRSFHGITALADSGFLLTGEEETGCCGHAQGLVVRTNSAGTAAWTQKFHSPAGISERLSASIAAADGFLLAGYADGFGSGSDGWLLRSDAAGNLRWQKPVGTAGDDYFSDVSLQADGVTFAGFSYVNGSSAQLVRADLSGNVTWTGNYQFNGEPTLGNRVAFGTAGLFVGGNASADGSGGDKSDAVVLRVDAWGNSDCATSGICAAKSVGACTDGNGCTADLCANGCVFTTPVANGGGCEDGNACTMHDTCQSATCTPGPATDWDGDGHVTTSCNGDDCDDSNALVYFGAPEVCDDGMTDNDCKGDGDANCTCPEYWTKATSDNGSVCAAGTPFWGDRAESVDGYLTDNGDGTWSDSNSQLQWQAGLAADVSSTAALSACLTLSLGGYSDWRVPSQTELMTLLDVKLSPTVPALIKLGTTAEYWTDIHDGAAGALKLTTGAVDWVDAASSVASVRCVRGGIPPYALGQRFTQPSDATVKDKLTGLTWQKTPQNNQVTWSQAVAYCVGLNADPGNTLGLHWRLPHQGELRSLVGDRVLPAYWDLGTFGGVGDNYWAYTKGALPGTAWRVDFNYGFQGPADTTNTAYVRCVAGVAGCGDDTECADGNSCTLDYCDPFSAKCSLDALDDGSSCDDGDVCTMKTTCTTRVCGNGVPADVDGDGFIRLGCPNGTDCDDTNSSINPNAIDYCDDSTIDQNCDGITDGPNCPCNGYYWPINSDNGHICAPDGPIWGLRPESTDGLFTDNGDGTASDSQTGLQWSIASQVGVDWNQATAACLASTLGGHSDWRMATMTELSTLFDTTKTPLAIASVFASTTDIGAYWSGWGGNDYSKLAYYANDGFNAGSGSNARCVRGGPPVNVSPRFVATSDTVYDTFTGVTWQRNPDNVTQFTWTDAAAHCATITTNGLVWRLPRFQELLSLVTFGAGGSQFNDAFPNGLGNGSWSSTVPAFQTGSAMAILLSWGFAGNQSQINTDLAICVH